MKQSFHALALPRGLRKRWHQHPMSDHRNVSRAVAATSAAIALLFLASLVVLCTRPPRSPPASSYLLRVVPLTRPTTVPLLRRPPPNGTTPAAPNLTTATATPFCGDHAHTTAASHGRPRGTLNTPNVDALQPSQHHNPRPQTERTTPLPPAAAPVPSASNRTTASASASARSCDVTKGEWVYDPDGGPHYTNSTCWTIQEHQNCIKFGRPDTGYLKWRWRPDGCHLPPFDPAGFLHLMRGKSMAFVGDSLARNQMQSLMCLLSGIEHPQDISESRDDNFRRMHYASHNFTVSSFWSPFLVRAEETHLPEYNWTGLWNLHLDEVDERWASRAREFDCMVISGGNWFTRPAIFTANMTVVGSNYYLRPNISTLSVYYGHNKAFETAFRAIASREEFRGVTVVLRTVSPSHFENGEWNTGGDCPRTKPFRRSEARMGLMDSTLYRDQLKAFQKAGRNKGLDFRLLDATQAMLLRPDGHPSRYGHLLNAAVAMPNDCVHWCLPGPIDVWNDMLLHILKT